MFLKCHMVSGLMNTEPSVVPDTNHKRQRQRNRCKCSHGEWVATAKNIQIYISHFSYSYKIKWENGISCLISALCINCKFTSERNSRILLITQSSGCASGVDYFRNFKVSYKLYSDIPERFQNAEYSRIWMCTWNRPFQNLNWSLKNQKLELFLWNLMVRYWSDRVKFWIYTAFRAFWTSHQLLSLPAVYRLNMGMWMWYNTIKGSKSWTFIFGWWN